MALMNLSAQQWHNILNGRENREVVLQRLLSVAPADGACLLPAAESAGEPSRAGQLVAAGNRGPANGALRLVDAGPSPQPACGPASRIIETLDRMEPAHKGPLFVMAEGLAYHFNNLFMGIAGHIALLRLKCAHLTQLSEGFEAVENGIANGALLLRILVDVFHRPTHRKGTAYPIDLSNDEIGRCIIPNDMLRVSVLPYAGVPDTQAILRLVSAGMALRLGETLDAMRPHLRATETASRPTGRGGNHADQALAGVERGRRILRRMLEYAGMRRMHRETCRLDVLVRETAQAFSGCFSGLRFTLETPDFPATVHGDARMLRRLLLELFMNAAEACEDGGQVEVRLEKMAAQPGGSVSPPPSLTLIVKDNGPGLPPGVAAGAVFTPFFTSRNPRRNLGLGLSTALGIVRQHGGKIEINSQIGMGVKVKAEFPIEAPAGGLPRMCADI
jgi:signal transduction histidine kinase